MARYSPPTILRLKRSVTVARYSPPTPPGSASPLQVSTHSEEGHQFTSRFSSRSSSPNCCRIPVMKFPHSPRRLTDDLVPAVALSQQHRDRTWTKVFGKIVVTFFGSATPWHAREIQLWCCGHSSTASLAGSRSGGSGFCAASIASAWQMFWAGLCGSWGRGSPSIASGALILRRHFPINRRPRSLQSLRVCGTISDGSRPSTRTSTASRSMTRRSCNRLTKATSSWIKPAMCA